MILVIMAAGMGTRYGGLKQLDPVGPSGEFILDYSIYDAKRAGFQKIVFIIKKENLELFRDTVGKRIEKIITVEYAFQEPDFLPAAVKNAIANGEIRIPEGRTKPWGTAHAVYCCKDLIDDDFAVINADDFYGREPYELLYQQMQMTHNENETHKKQQYCMVGYRLQNTLTENGHVSRGVCTADDKAMLCSIEEHTKIQKSQDGELKDLADPAMKDLSPMTIVSMNCWGFTRKLFDAIDQGMLPFMINNMDRLDKAEYYLLDIVQGGIQDGTCEVKVLSTDAAWFGVTYHEDREKVVSSIMDLVAKGEYPKNLWCV